MKPVKIYTDPSHYLNSRRGYLHPLLKPFIGKPKDFSDVSRRKMYGLGEEDFAVITDIQRAKVGILPMAWNYYLYEKKMDLAYAFYEKCRKYNKIMFSWVGGDFGVKVPDLDGMIVHRASGYRSKLPDYHRGMPVFISDPLLKWYERKEPFFRSKKKDPIVGFCGQAKGSFSKYIYDVIRTCYRNVKSNLGLRFEDPQTLYPSTLLRAKVLKKLERSPGVQTNFIKREKYRAGVQTEEERRKTTLEFYDNMIASNYVVCVRGGGNFSVRLYETLAMGRIPLFVDTDCLLPLADTINWKEKTVWIDKENLPEIGNLLSSFHEGLSDKEFEDLQLEARLFWRSYLTLKGFFSRELLI